MLLSEHVCCVVVTFKMTVRVGQSFASNFALSLNIPPQKLFRWFRRPQLWATGDWQLHHNNAPAHDSSPCRGFLRNIKSPRWFDSALLQPRFGALWFLAFPKTKITFEGKRFQTVNEIQENMMEQLMAIGRSQGAYFEGDWGIIVLCTVFLVSCIFFNKCLYFSSYMAGYLLDRPHKY